MILVTGAKGFLGRNLVTRLEALDYEVIEYDMRGRNTYENFREMPWERIKRVYHLGAVTDTTCGDTKYLMNKNVEFSVDLFSWCTANNIPVNYASSASVYGNSTNHSYNPLNQYAISKLWIDMHVEELNNSLITGFRFYNVYGMDENKGNQTSMVCKFIQQAMRNKEIQVFEGSDKIYRDFICIDDALNFFMKRDIQTGIIHDVGTGTSVSVLAIAQKISKLTGAKIEKIDFPSYLKGKYQYHTKSPIQIPNCKSVFNWIEENLYSQ